MFKKILSPGTTDSVLGRFRKAIDQLEAVAEHHSDLAGRHEATASQAKQLAAIARAEASKAADAVQRLTSVFG